LAAEPFEKVSDSEKIGGNFLLRKRGVLSSKHHRWPLVPIFSKAEEPAR
jgi:hypothetical protein